MKVTGNTRGQSTRCRAMTRRGTQCRHDVLTGSNYCHVHREKTVDASGGTPALSGSPLKVLRATVVDLVGLVAIVGAMVVLGREVFRESVEIAPIAIPKRLAEAGHSPIGISERIRDHMETIRQRAKTTMRREQLALASELPDIEVPGIGISIRAVSTYLRGLLSIRDKRITGEIEMLDDCALERLPSSCIPSGDKSPRATVKALTEEAAKLGRCVVLRLRVTGNPIKSLSPVPISDFDALLANGAGCAVRATEPFLFASYIFDIDPNLGHDEARRITRMQSLAAEERARAWTLIGNIFKGKDEARANQSYRTAIELAPKLAEVHNNLGNLLWQQGKKKEAEKKYRTAIELDPKFVAAHSNLGALLRKLGKPQEAEKEYRTAIKLDPILTIPPIVDSSPLLWSVIHGMDSA